MKNFKQSKTVVGGGVKISLFAISIFLLPACQFGVGEKESAAKINAAEAQAEAERPHYLKPGAGIYITNPKKVEMALGETLTVTVNLRTTHKLGTLEINVNSDDALQTWVDSSQPMAFSLTEKSEVPVEIEVTANSEGKHYVHIFASIESANGTQRRAMVLPVYVGDKAKITNLNKKRPEDSEPTRLPVQESITNF